MNNITLNLTEYISNLHNPKTIILTKPLYNTCNIYYFNILKKYFLLIFILIGTIFIINILKIKEKEIIIGMGCFIIFMLSVFMYVSVFIS